MTPLAIDLFCGLGGWTDGLLAEGYYVVGFDIERHHYGDAKYPAQLVLQSVLTLHGSQFKDAALIVASPPCQEFSYMAMPWTRAKEKAKALRDGRDDPKRLTALFDACFRIQREACEAAGRHIPLVVENVKGAQPWVGRARWNFGSFYLWGDVPALMPIAKAKVGGFSWSDFGKPDYVAKAFNGEAERAIKNSGGSWFAIGSPGQKETGRNPVHGIADAERERERERERVQRHEEQGSGRLRTQSPASVRMEETAHVEQEQRSQAGVSNDCEDPARAVSSYRPHVSADGVKGFTPNGERLGQNQLGRRCARCDISARIIGKCWCWFPTPIPRQGMPGPSTRPLTGHLTGARTKNARRRDSITRTPAPASVTADAAMCQKALRLQGFPASLSIGS